MIKVKKIIKYLLLIILVLYLAINIMVLSFFNIGKEHLNKNNIINYVSKVDLYEILKNKFSNDIKYIDIKNELLDCGITEEAFNYLISSDELNNYINTVITNSLNEYLDNKKLNLYFNSEELKNIIINNIYELDYNSDIINEYDINDINNKLEKKIPNIVEKANKIIDKFIDNLFNNKSFNKYIKYLYKYFNIFDIIYSKVVEIILYINLISFILIICYFNDYKYKSFKYIGISLLFSSIIFLIISVLLSNIKLKYAFLRGILNKTVMYSAVYFIIFLILIFLNIIVYFRRKKLKNEIKNEKI